MMHGNHIFERSVDFVARYYRTGAFDPARGMRAIGMRPAPRRWPWQWSVGAAAALLIAIGLAFHFITSSNQLTTLENHNQLAATYYLPDSTRVELTRGSRASYDRAHYADNRRLMLEGAAYLTVTPDESHPFRVVAGMATVTVLGTEFYVDELAADSVAVRVASGRVRLSNPDGEAVLTRGMEALASAEGVQVVAGELTLKVDVSDMSLTELSEQLQQGYGLRIANIPPANPRVTLAFEGEPRELAAMINSLLSTEVEIK